MRTICYAEHYNAERIWLVDRQISRPADYHRALKSFREDQRTEAEPLRIFHAGEELVRSEDIADRQMPRFARTIPRDREGSARHRSENVYFNSEREWRQRSFGLRHLASVPAATHFFNAELDFLREGLSGHRDPPHGGH